MFRKLLFLVILSFLFVVLGHGVGLAFSQEVNPDQVILRMNWFPYVDYIPYVIGVEKGFYLEEGIGLKIVPTKGSTLTTKLIAAGDGDFGVAAMTTVLIARTKGMPLKVLAAFHQDTPVSIVSLKEKDIKIPKDLEGKSLSSDPQSMKHNQFKAFCKNNNVDIGKIDINPIKGSDFIHILENRVDFTMAFSYMADAMLRRKGYKINEMKLSDYGVDIYGNGIIVNQNFMKKNPALVKRFIRATLKSWNYAIEHPAEATLAAVKAYPALKEQDLVPQIIEVISLMKNESTKEHGLGFQSREKWQQTQDLLFQQGIIDKKVNLDKIYTNQFLVQ